MEQCIVGKWLLFIAFLIGSFGSRVTYGMMKIDPEFTYDYSLVRTDTSGEELWSKTFSFGAKTTCSAVTALRNCGFAIAGPADSCHAEDDGRFRVRLVVTDDEGNLLRGKCFPTDIINYCREVAQIDNGQLVLAGVASPGVSCLVCVDEEGEILWNKTYEKGCSYALIPASDGGFVLVGDRWSNDTLYDGWILKTNSVGEQLWLKTFSGPYREYLRDVTESSDGTIAVVGHSDTDNTLLESAGWLILLDSLGNVLTERYYGQGAKYSFNNVQEAPDGGFLISGERFYWPENGESSHYEFLMKTKQSGDSLWCRTDEIGWEQARPVEVAGTDSISVLNYLEQALRFQDSDLSKQLIAEVKVQRHYPFDLINFRYFFGMQKDGCFYIRNNPHPIS